MNPNTIGVDLSQNYLGSASLKVGAGTLVESPRFAECKIAASRAQGEYRYLRFAWRCPEGGRIRLRFLLYPETALSLVDGAKRSDLTTAAASRASVLELEASPLESWQVIMRDLLQDCGEFSFNAVALEAVDGSKGWLDEIWLAQSKADFPTPLSE